MQTIDEADRLRSLLQAQSKAKQLFAHIEENAIIKPGLSEQQINDAIFALAQAQFSTDKYWHKRVVRAGENTLLSYSEDPADRIVQENDVVFVDLGPVFVEWEADFGKTFVVGNHEVGTKIVHDLADVFRFGQLLYQCEMDIVASEFFDCIKQYIEHLGWQLGNYHVGHIVGELPHSRSTNNKNENVLSAENETRLNVLDALGRNKHWIFEVHIIDRELGVGGFYEDFLAMHRDVK
jgi:Xaa-Pro dipeptidase